LIEILNLIAKLDLRRAGEDERTGVGNTGSGDVILLE
jgi:hypothetical protein